MKFKIKPHLVIFITSLIGAQLGLATPVLIDNFNSTQNDARLFTNSNAHDATVGPGIAGILGGWRVLDDFCVSGCDAQTTSILLGRAAGHNDIVLNNDDFSFSSGLVTYSGSANGPKQSGVGAWDGSAATSTPLTYGLAGVDLSGGGTNTQISVIAHTDVAGVQLIATFYVGAGTGFARAIWDLPAGPGDQQLTSHFYNNSGTSTFMYSGAANVSMWNTIGAITAITFQIDGSNSGSADTNITYFAGDAPEPASFGMLASGLGGLFWFARKRAQTKK